MGSTGPTALPCASPCCALHRLSGASLRHRFLQTQRPPPWPHGWLRCAPPIPRENCLDAPLVAAIGRPRYRPWLRSTSPGSLTLPLCSPLWGSMARFLGAPSHADSLAMEPLPRGGSFVRRSQGTPSPQAILHRPLHSSMWRNLRLPTGFQPCVFQQAGRPTISGRNSHPKRPFCRPRWASHPRCPFTTPGHFTRPLLAGRMGFLQPLLLSTGRGRDDPPWPAASIAFAGLECPVP